MKQPDTQLRQPNIRIDQDPTVHPTQYFPSNTTFTRTKTTAVQISSRYQAITSEETWLCAKDTLNKKIPKSIVTNLLHHTTLQVSKGVLQTRWEGWVSAPDQELGARTRSQKMDQANLN